ncbi:MAG TPA: amino acid racemase [Burkholderiales bacterium]|nr:amino acid racemase [Burkholderiales bacterium]
MRPVGLIGGVTWLSTLDYYRAINEEVARRLGGVHSARLLLVSLDFHDVRSLASRGDEPALLELYADAARKLEQAGAQALVLCTNTAHRRAPELEKRIGIPLLHIADAAGRAAKSAGATRVGLLGTRATMEEAFVREPLERRYGLEVLVPPDPDREILEHIIFDEMARGEFLPAAAAHAARLVKDLAMRGAQAVVLGCTELPILLRDVATPCRTLDTARLHALAAAEFSLQGTP